eukprot:CAMPEP_0194356678 /NCGR_PEP_ID=MMETSP0174-20130528/4271_1 /TAXON_ID=216777 /ORGANISM="Proboscia alata, Strain PI-D3" /LENGTH=407 /DNA_ID=CAMNT_0039126371 /DNA_START=229 /DNA_END=1452 /DNA_ORIENTATION=+
MADDHTDHEEHDSHDVVDEHEGHDDHEGHGQVESLESRSESNDKPYGLVFGATLLVNLAALIGVIFLIPAAQEMKKNTIAVQSFAAGALIAAACFLILPESGALLMVTESAEEHADHRSLEGDDEREEAHGEISWKFGISILGGFILPSVIALFFDKSGKDAGGLENHAAETTGHLEGSTKKTVNVQTGVTLSDEGKDLEKSSETSKESSTEKPGNVQTGVTLSDEGTDLEKSSETSKDDMIRAINYNLCASILLGDGFHNFVDGVFIGISFLYCDRSLSTSIMLATLYHEIAQELADYFLLTTYGGLSNVMALFLNFASGLFVIFGGLLILAVDISDEGVGSILGVSAGVYFHIAAAECFPRVMEEVNSCREKRLLSIVAFVTGAVPIGLVLLGHGHCEVGGHDEH